MDDAAAVGVVERIGDLAGDPDRVLEGSWPFARSRSRSDSPSTYGIMYQRRPSALAGVVQRAGCGDG